MFYPLGFTVKANGKIDYIKNVRGVHPALDEEAVRSKGLMLDWKPGSVNGKVYTFECIYLYSI